MVRRTSHHSYERIDHLIPRVTHAHPYLPASLRTLAGLPTNEAVFASAAFTFEQLWRRRLGHGWLDVIVPQQDADGTLPDKVAVISKTPRAFFKIFK